ncbi:hypothetical protein AMELA_G00213190 [Ameiurus melas]|uniref:Uncharacterized protein n=1 Tax=Ameiurus melas TaxID=219545 RepID=A0A7J6A0D6_AMEME|nr:hypothetical protein AMELA_G00213190 [Ameiurus melas]
MFGETKDSIASDHTRSSKTFRVPVFHPSSFSGIFEAFAPPAGEDEAFLAPHFITVSLVRHSIPRNIQAVEVHHGEKNATSGPGTKVSVETTGYNGLLGKGDDDVTGNESPDWTDGNPRKSINKLLVRGQMRNKGAREEGKRREDQSSRPVSEKKMRIWECVTLLCIFMISPPTCRASTIQQQNQTPLPASAIRSADVTVQPCGQPETDGKVQQDPKRTRGFPERKSPLDPLSISPVKLKRTQKEKQSRRIKGSQKRRPGAGSLHITTGQNGSFVQIRSGEGASVDPTEKNDNSTNHQRLEISGATAHTTNTERNPSGRTRTSKQGARTGFGLPVDRIGLGRLPGGRR